jgi:NitT/TauT family transport system permease protein
MSKRLSKLIIFYLLLFGLWQGLVSLELWPEYLFPSPVGVLKTLFTGFEDKTFIIGILISMKRLIIGYGFSVVVGLGLGLLIGRIKTLDETIGSLVLGFQALPSICWLPLALLWFGLSESAMIAIVILGSLFSIIIGADTGVKNIPPIYIRAARTMGARGLKLYTKVIIPAALPSIISGFKQGWSFAWRSLMAAELLYVGLGLGHLLMMGRELNDMNQVVAVMIVIIVIGIIIDRLFFAKMENKVREIWGLV